jgi:hypothetical protein
MNAKRVTGWSQPRAAEPVTSGTPPDDETARVNPTGGRLV